MEEEKIGEEKEEEEDDVYNDLHVSVNNKEDKRCVILAGVTYMVDSEESMTPCSSKQALKKRIVLTDSDQKHINRVIKDYKHKSYFQ